MLNLYNKCVILLGLITALLLITTTDTYDAHFTGHPPNPQYVVKGETANFIWIYHVQFDKYIAFDYYSPVWFYRDANNNEYEIGKDYKYDAWKFHLSTSTCPARLLSPTVRVSREYQATLVINSTTLADSGTYGCRLNLRRDFPKTSTVDLIITEIPSFTVRPHTKTITTEHADLSILCTAVGPPTPTVEWVHLASNVTRARGNGSAVLQILNINRNYSGTEYKCRAVNNPQEGPVETKTEIVVYYKPTIDGSLSSTNLTSWNGNNITLRCEYLNGLPAPTWTFYRPNGEIITTNVHNTVIGSEVTVSTGKDSFDYGRYKCKATNVAGSDEHSMIVTQLFPPASPEVFITDRESTSVTIRWITPAHNGGSPITGYKIIIGSRTFHTTNTSTKHHTVSGLSPSTNYVVKIYSVNIAGYSNRSRVYFTTRGQVKLPSPQQDGTVAAGVSTGTFLVISLIANVLLAVYIYRSRTKPKKKPSESGQSNAAVEMETGRYTNAVEQASQPSVVYEPVAKPRSKPTLPKKPGRLGKRVIPPQPNQAIYEVPGNENSSQDQYQQLNPDMLQHDQTVQYEPLRTNLVPLRNGPREHPRQQNGYSFSNTSYS